MMRMLAGTAALTLLAAGASAQDAPDLTSVVQKFSYAMGYRVARDMTKQGIKDIDSAALAAGVNDAMASKAFPFDREQLTEIMTAYRTMVEAEQASLAGNNAEVGKKFLAENETAEGVQTLPGGIQYKIHTEGEGALPAADDTVRVHYSGKLLDGTEFDSSYKRGEPTELNLQNVIPGWRTALTAMPTGSKWTIWIPSDLAYGNAGAGGLIGPNSTLSFDIELIAVVEKTQ